MVKLLVGINMFSVNQSIYKADTANNKVEIVAAAAMDRIPEAICALMQKYEAEEIELEGPTDYI